MTAREVLALTLLVILMREAAMTHDEWESNRDSGDETDDDHEYDIGFDPAPELLAGLNEQAVCPKGHVCEVRASDGALWCAHPACDCAYYSDFAGLIYPRPDNSPDEKAA